MALNLEKMHTAKGAEERIQEGTYMSRISALIDLGIQPQTDWKTGEPVASKPRLLLTWELPTEKITITHNDGEEEEVNRFISKEYTASNYEMANIVKLSNVMIAGDKNLSMLLNVEAMVSIGSTSTGNAKVISCVKAPKGMPIPELSKGAQAFDFDEPDADVFKVLPAWVQTKITTAENYNGFADEWLEEKVPA